MGLCASATTTLGLFLAAPAIAWLWMVTVPIEAEVIGVPMEERLAVVWQPEVIEPASEPTPSSAEPIQSAESATAEGPQSDTQTAHALVIRFGLVEDLVRDSVGRRLVELVEADEHRIGTGFVGTPLVCDALCDVGAPETAYRLLLQTECPSWLYPVVNGATTIWERWDGIRPDGSRNPGDMNSFNHYAFGAVAAWLHRTVAGLNPGEPGYRSIVIRPRPGPGLDHARAWLDTPYGRAESGWERIGDGLRVHAVVPPGTTARIELPDGTTTVAGVGRHAWTVRSDTEENTP